MEETESPYNQGHFDIDKCHQAFIYADSSSCEMTREPIPQLRQALAVIENVCKTSRIVWVNKQQCKQMADSFSAVGEALKGSRWERNLVHCYPSDGKSSQIQLLDKLLTVLRKGESLVSCYNTWNFLGWMDSREAMFKDVMEELDIMKAQFHEGLTDVGHREDCAFPASITSELRRSPAAVVTMENSEMDEYQDRLIVRIWQSEQTTGTDMDELKLDITRHIAEGLDEVKCARDSIMGRIYSGDVGNLSTWKGVPYAEIVFETYLPIRVLQALELDFINKLSHHPHIEGLSVGFNEQGSFVMDCMSGMNLRDLIESQWWKIPVSKECVTVPSLNVYCDFLDILLQTGLDIAYLHSKGVVHRELTSGNTVIDPGPNRVDIKLEDFSSCKGYGEGIGFRRFRAPKMQRWESDDCHSLVDAFSRGILCTEILTGRRSLIQTLPSVGLDGLGSMRETALSKILHSEEQKTFLKHLCENDWKEYGDVKRCLQKERLMCKVILDSADHMGTENNPKAFEISALKSVGSEKEEAVTCQNSRHSSLASLEGLAYVDGVQEHRRRTDYDIANVDTKLILEDLAESAQAIDDKAQPSERCPPKTTVTGSCAQEATSTSLVQQDSRVILRGHQVPQIQNDGEPARKRNRTRMWSDEENLALLELTEEAQRLDMGPDWGYVSDNLFEEYGFDRASISCQQQWGALRNSYRAIQDHESETQNGTSSCVSYWKMDEDERSKNKLQRAFDYEWFEVIERTLTAKPFEEETRIFQMNADHPSSALPLYQLQSSAIHRNHFGSSNCDEVLDDQSTDEEREETDIESEDEGLSIDSLATLESQAEVTADSDYPEDLEGLDEAKQSHEPCYETNSEDHMYEQSRVKSFCQTNSKYVGKKRSGKDDFGSWIVPYVTKQVDDAIKPLVNSVLRRLEENEQKHREELLAIKEEKLALKREKMEFRRRALACCNERPACLPQINQNQDVAQAVACDTAP